jgi:ribonuclease P protein subunit RPR2
MKHKKIQILGIERIYRLFELAEKEFEKHPERSKRYIEIAREIVKKSRARIPDELKTKFCKNCNTFLKEGKNSEIQSQGNMKIIKCLECGFKRKTGRKNKKNDFIK